MTPRTPGQATDCYKERSLSVVGLGRMGRPIARTLLAARHHVRGWNRSPLDPGLTAGIPVCASLEEAAAADVTVLVLANSDAVDAVLPALEPFLPTGRIVVDMGSSDPARSRVHAERLAVAGVGWVDAPISGGPEGAESGTLAIMAGGAEDYCAAVEPLLRALGSFVRVGGPGAGHTVKIVNQVIVGLTIQAVAEALALAEGAQVDPRLVQRALAGGSADSRVLQAHGTRMIERDFAARATVQTMLKDSRLALALAESVGVELPHLTDLAARWERLIAAGMGGADCAALFSLLRHR